MVSICLFLLLNISLLLFLTMSELVSFHAKLPLIGPSLLASDMSNMDAESKRVLDAGADYLHLDVMDGHFVPNLTFGAPVTNPEKWVDDMADAGTDIFTFHIEVTSIGTDLCPLIETIKSKGMKVGLALKPGTPVETVFPYLDLLDQVLVMTVEPGFGGQKFMVDMMPKIRALRERCPDINIQVDGGLGPDTIDAAAAAGANMIVAGSSVFKGSPAHVISVMRRSVEKFGNGKSDAELSPLIPIS